MALYQAIQDNARKEGESRPGHGDDRSRARDFSRWLKNPVTVVNREVVDV